MFCPKCGSLLLPKKKEGKTIVECSCGYKQAGEVKLSEKKTTEEKKVEVIEEQKETLPITTEKCSKCGNDEAYYFLKQTRAADEAPTRFLKCTKCGHTWREYS
jgi:DNA-directed RNA polymerase subunit M